MLWYFLKWSIKNFLPTRIRGLAPCRLVHLVDPMVLCSRDPFLAKVTAYRGEVTLFGGLELR